MDNINTIFITANCAIGKQIRVSIQGEAGLEEFTLQGGDARELNLYEGRSISVSEEALPEEEPRDGGPA
jgi:hypothetical protein